MPRYSPFDKTLDSIEAGDLEVLRLATEGWYVEYKREASKADTMAKSVSAFANTHGGWLFYGVAEKSKDEAVAGSFPGIARADVDPALQRLRQAIANAVNPSPHYEARAIWGPDTTTGLAADRAVICVYVPKGPNSPYVHKSGQIYRRVADGSEPKPENDRFVLDQLWRRSEQILEEYKTWVDRDPELSEVEAKTPFIRVLMAADLWHDRDAWLDAPLPEVRSLLKAEEISEYSIPFDTVHTTSGGFVGRQLRNNNPETLGLTYRLHRGLTSEIIIPLPLHVPARASQLGNELGDFVQAYRFCSMLEANGHKKPRVVDLNFVLLILTSVASLQEKIMKLAGWEHGYHCKVVVLNALRTIPFVDAHSVMAEFEAHGIPMLLNGRVVSDGTSHPGSFRLVEPFADVENRTVRLALQGLSMFGPVAEAFGIPGVLSEIAGDGPNYMVEFLELGQKALAAQAARAARNSGNQ